ncbi:MAG TPA: hypothetical protein DIC42_02325 [Holosporales bacterium]|nr:hypothetical protein [Holosporales bacterium]
MTNVISINQKIERLKDVRKRLERRISDAANTDRKARTRTLIQLGGLLNITNLLELTNINLGEDLEIDQINQDKAATLLGLLQHLTETMPPLLSPEQQNDFKQKGIRILKMRAYEKENG